MKQNVDVPEQIRNVHQLTDEKMQQLYEEVQIVYAVAQEDVALEHGTIAKGTPVALLYPQTTDESTGRISMRLKVVDARTGALSLPSVCVFDPNDANTPHKMSNFSPIPTPPESSPSP